MRHIVVDAVELMGWMALAAMAVIVLAVFVLDRDQEDGDNPFE